MSSEPDSHPGAAPLDRDAARRRGFGLGLAIALSLAAGLVTFLGTRDSWDAPSLAREARAPASGGAADPAWALELPEAPHRREFETSCLICHSARLPFGQPPFGREKWSEIVHKMVAVYGAPVTPEEESRVVDYLLAVRPPAR